MKTAKQLLKLLFLTGFMLVGTVNANAHETKYDLKPAKNPSSRPKAPLGLQISVEVNSVDASLTFEFSQDIQTLYVVLTTDSTGEIQSGVVDHADPVMSATINDGTSYTLTCTTDAGIEFETSIEL